MQHIGRFLFRRVCFLLGTLLLVSLIVFAVTQVLPGDVATMILGQHATPEDLATLRDRLGLNRPAYIQYAQWIGGMVRGDWGESLRMDVPVRGLILERLLASLQLAAFTFIMAIPLAILLGTVAGVYAGRWVDNLISVGGLTAVSLPEFVTGPVLILVFSVGLGWFPATSRVEAGGFWERLQILVLPGITLTLVLFAHTSRMTRASIASVMQTGYVRMAFLKGLSLSRVVLGQALRNALAPTVTVVALHVGWLIGGLVVVENIFGYPGLGWLLVFAIGQRDIPLIQGTCLVVASAYGVLNLLADIAYAYLDPRIRY